MAIRIYERQQGIAPTPGARVNNYADAGAFGGQVWKATENLGEVLRRKAEDLEDADTMETMNRFRRDIEDYHNNPDTGLYNTRTGRNAENVTVDADKWIDNRMSEYAGKLKSARAAENFLNMGKKLWGERSIANSRFEAQQVRQYREGEAKAAIALGLEDISRNYADDAAVGAATQQMMMALELQTRGMGDDAKKLALQGMQSDIALTRFGQMIDADPQNARGWYEAHKDEMTADARGRAENALDRADEKARVAAEQQAREAEKDEIARTVESVWQTYGTDERAGCEAIDSDPNSTFEQKQKNRSLYKARVSDAKRWETEEQREWFNSTNDAIVDSKSMEEAQAIIENSGATGMDRKQMEGLAAQKYRPEAFKEDIRDWKQAYEEVVSGKIKNADDLIQRWNGILSRGTLQSLTRTFYQQKPGGTGGKGKGPDYVGFSWSDSVKKSMEALRIDPTTQDGALFITAIGDEKAAREQKKGGSLTPVELTDLITEMTKKHVVQKGTFSDTQMPEYLKKAAEENGFRWSYGVGYIKELPDGTVVLFDPKQYKASEQKQTETQEQQGTEKTPSDALTSADNVPQPPAPEAAAIQKPAESPEEAKEMPQKTQTSIPETPKRKRMPDGRYLDENRPLRTTRPAKPQPAGAKVTGKAFIDEIKPDVVEVAESINVPASVMMAQALLESGWGKSRIGNNLFGVKAGKHWKGSTRTAATHEEVNGQRIKINAAFRDYESVGDSIRDLGRLLSGKRYAAVRSAKNYVEAARALQKSGYATDSKYAAKLIKIIEDNGLDVLDRSPA